MLSYYHSLAPFREWFKTGVPVLTYHKLGPRPRGARIKGLYLSQTLFSRQLAELRKAGFAAISLGAITGAQVHLPRRIALSFDDGFSNVHRYGLDPLACCQFRAIEFLVADLIGKSNEWEQGQGEVRERLMDAAQVREWLAAGHEIGSHTLRHPFLTQVPMAEAREEIVASKKKLEDMFACPVEHFCYPYGDWNEKVRDLAQEAGYQTACTTEIGINTSRTPPLLLKRITARYPSRRLSSWLRRWLGREVQNGLN